MVSDIYSWRFEVRDTSSSWPHSEKTGIEEVNFIFNKAAKRLSHFSISADKYCLNIALMAFTMNRAVFACNESK